MKVSNSVKWIALVALLISCEKKQQDDRAQEIQYRYFNLENQGWKSRQHSETVGQMTFTATEVPIQYYILKDMGTDNLIAADSVYEANKRERIVEFTFENTKHSDVLDREFTKMDYQSAVKYMSFTIQKDFLAVTSSKDTVACAGVMFERNFKVAPFSKAMLFFSGIDPNDKIQIIYNDRLFGRGTVKFNFKEKLLLL